MFDAILRRCRGPMMLLTPPVLLGIALFLGPAPAGAQTIHGLALSAEGFQFAYEEKDNFAVDSEDPFVRLGLDYTIDAGAGWFLRLGGNYAQGEAELTVAGLGSAGGVDQVLWEAAIEIGRDFGLEGTVSVAPFLGLRYRHWEDQSSGVITSGGAFGFDREIDNLFLQLGATAYFALGDAWTVAVEGEIGALVYGREKGKLSALPGITFDLDNEFVSGWQAGGEILVRKRLTNWLTLALGPFVRYWDIDDSELDPVVPLFVPANQTMEAGVVFKVVFGSS